MSVWMGLLLSVPLLGGGVNGKNKEGAELYRKGDYDAALAAFTQAQVDSPDAAEIHYNIGNVHYRKQEMDKALEEYRAAQGGGEHVQEYAHYNEGNVHYRAKDVMAAIESYKRALKIDPGDIEARQNLELALKQEKQPQGKGGSSGESREDDKERSEKQNQDRQQQQQEQNQQQQMNQSQQSPSGMSKEDAERILAALAEMEKAEQQHQQQKRKMKVRRGKKKDW